MLVSDHFGLVSLLCVTKTSMKGVSLTGFCGRKEALKFSTKVSSEITRMPALKTGPRFDVLHVIFSIYKNHHLLRVKQGSRSGVWSLKRMTVVISSANLRQPPGHAPQQRLRSTDSYHRCTDPHSGEFNADRNPYTRC